VAAGAIVVFLIDLKRPIVLHRIEGDGNEKDAAAHRVPIIESAEKIVKKQRSLSISPRRCAECAMHLAHNREIETR
jgi:hypothetical protein